MSVKEKLMRDWVYVLKTTEEPQTRGTLKSKEGYCCLGIAAEKVLGHKMMLQENSGSYRYVNPVTGNSVGNILDEKDSKAMGLNKELTEDESEYFSSMTNDGVYTRMEACYKMNDSLDMSFNEIGEKLEELGWVEN